MVPSLLHSVPGRSTRGGVRVVGPCVSYTPSGYESRRRVFAVCGDRSGRERVPRSSSRRVLVVHRADIFHRTLRARPFMAPDVDLRSSTAIALRPGRIQPIGMAADYRSRSTSSEGPAPARTRSCSSSSRSSSAARSRTLAHRAGGALLSATRRRGGGAWACGDIRHQPVYSEDATSHCIMYGFM